MRVKFWGVRGSVPWATPTSIGHGCNTACIEVADEQNGTLLVLDAGSGIVGLGGALDGEPRPVPILLTHYHWDHLQGLPFFAPLYHPGWEPVIYAPAIETRDAAFLETIFQSPFFPVPYERLPARPGVKLIGPGTTRVQGFDVRAIQINHPGGALAYRIKGSRGDLVYATDHEFGDSRIDDPLAEFAAGASALILDAHFTPDEADAHQGWGHGTWAQCAEFAARVGAGRLWLFHHKPGRTDVEMVAIETAARAVFANTDAAGEGDTFEI
jgi:phosphoribosyl 1,2-cyclic phosphodiesterase